MKINALRKSRLTYFQRTPYDDGQDGRNSKKVWSATLGGQISVFCQLNSSKIFTTWHDDLSANSWRNQPGQAAAQQRKRKALRKADCGAILLHPPWGGP